MTNPISNDRVKQQTGKDWQAWFKVLDDMGAINLSHKEIASWLDNHSDMNGWWAQMVTVGYEQARGLRQKHERPDGFEISVSKTIAVPIAKLFNTWVTDTQRKKWLNEDIILHKITTNKSIRITWVDGKKSVSVNFYQKSADKTQVTVQHSGLADAAASEHMETFWKEKLIQLQNFIL